jgi:hypothetical protein
VTPDQARRLLLNLPTDWRPLVARAFRGIWGDGYAAGAKQRAAPNPYDSLLPPPAELGKPSEDP